MHICMHTCVLNTRFLPLVLASLFFFKTYNLVNHLVCYALADKLSDLFAAPLAAPAVDLLDADLHLESSLGRTITSPSH